MFVRPAATLFACRPALPGDPDLHAPSPVGIFNPMSAHQNPRASRFAKQMYIIEHDTSSSAGTNMAKFQSRRDLCSRNFVVPSHIGDSCAGPHNVILDLILNYDTDTRKRFSRCAF